VERIFRAVVREPEPSPGYIDAKHLLQTSLRAPATTGWIKGLQHFQQLHPTHDRVDPGKKLIPPSLHALGAEFQFPKAFQPHIVVLVRFLRGRPIIPHQTRGGIAQGAD
jgi:hypothetical protein